MRLALRVNDFKVSQSRADTWITRAESLLARAESGRRRTPVESTFVENFFPDLVRSKGQDWCEGSLDIYVRFLKENMLGSLQKALDVINQFQPDGRKMTACQRPLDRERVFPTHVCLVSQRAFQRCKRRVPTPISIASTSVKPTIIPRRI